MKSIRHFSLFPRHVLAAVAQTVLLVGVAGVAPAGAAEVAPFPVTIAIDAGKPLGELKPIWRFFGADEPNYATMKDGKKLIAELGELRPQQVYFRAHNLLCTGDGSPALKWGSTNIYTEDAQGRPVYDWTIVDRIFDTYLARGVRPYVEIGFMPQALSTHPEPYQHEWRPGASYGKIGTGWSYHRKITQSGASSFTSGPSIASTATAAPRSNSGIGRSGTRPTAPPTGTLRPMILQVARLRRRRCAPRAAHCARRRPRLGRSRR